ASDLVRVVEQDVAGGEVVASGRISRTFRIREELHQSEAGSVHSRGRNLVVRELLASDDLTAGLRVDRARRVAQPSARGERVINLNEVSAGVESLREVACPLEQRRDGENSRPHGPRVISLVRSPKEGLVFFDG